MTVTSTSAYGFGTAAAAFTVSDTKAFRLGDWVDVVDTGATDTYMAGFVTAVAAGSSITVTPELIYAGVATTASTWQLDQAQEPVWDTTTTPGAAIASFGAPTATGATSLSQFYPLAPGSAVTGASFAAVATTIHNSIAESLTLNLGTAPGPTRTDMLYIVDSTGAIKATATSNNATTASFVNFVPVPGTAYAVELVRSSLSLNTTWQWTWGGTTAPTNPGGSTFLSN